MAKEKPFHEMSDEELQTALVNTMSDRDALNERVLEIRSHQSNRLTAQNTAPPVRVVPNRIPPPMTQAQVQAMLARTNQNHEAMVGRVAAGLEPLPASIPHAEPEPEGETT